REENQSELARLLRLAMPLVSAWCSRHGNRRPSWVDDTSLLAEALAGRGVLHVRRLDTVGLLGQMQTAGQWPDGMPLTIDARDCGPSDADLAAQQDAAE